MGGGSTQNGRTSFSKRLGLKRGHGCRVNQNEVLVRQHGKRWHPGENVVLGRDFTLSAGMSGIVRMERDHERKKTIVHVDPAPETPSRRDFILEDISKFINNRNL